MTAETVHIRSILTTAIASRPKSQLRQTLFFAVATFAAEVAGHMRPDQPNTSDWSDTDSEVLSLVLAGVCLQSYQSIRTDWHRILSRPPVKEFEVTG